MQCSLRGANGLLEIPAGNGVIKAGSLVSTLVTGPLDQNAPKIEELSKAADKHAHDHQHVGCRCHVDTPAASSSSSTTASSAAAVQLNASGFIGGAFAQIVSQTLKDQS